MKGLTAAVALCVLALGIGCSSITIKHDYDRDADFTSYRTFDWLENRPGAPEGARAAAQRNALIDKRIKDAVVSELAAKGLKENLEAPDLLLVYHLGVENKIDVTDWGYRYGGAYGGWHGRGIDVYQYREGTLIVDLIDARSMELVWRGAAQATIDENPTPERSEKRISEAVAKMFKGYPPAQ